MKKADICKICREKIPKLALYALNKVAIENGFCSWRCLTLVINPVKSRSLIKEYVNRGERTL